MDFKKQAINLKKSLKDLGYDIKLTQAQEALARSEGHKTRHSKLKEIKRYKLMVPQDKADGGYTLFFCSSEGISKLNKLIKEKTFAEDPILNSLKDSPFILKEISEKEYFISTGKDQIEDFLKNEYKWHVVLRNSVLIYNKLERLITVSPKKNISKAKEIFSKELFTAANFNKMFKEGKYSYKLSSLVDFLFDIYDYQKTGKEKVSIFIGLRYPISTELSDIMGLKVILSKAFSTVFEDKYSYDAFDHNIASDADFEWLGTEVILENNEKDIQEKCGKIEDIIKREGIDYPIEYIVFEDEEI